MGHGVEIQSYERRRMFTVRDMVAAIFRQRKIILGIFLGVLAVTCLLGMWTRKYEAHTKILVLRQREDAILSARANAPAQNPQEVTEEDLNSEAELLKSDDVLRKVVLATGLQHQSSSRFFPRQSEDRAIAAAVNQLGKSLDVGPARKTNVIIVGYRSTDPQMAMTVLKAVEAAYLEKHEEVHRPSGELQFFDQQTARLREEVETSQSKLAEFTEKNGVVAAELERDLTLKQLADFDSSAHQAQTEAAATAQRIRSLRAQLSTMQPRLTTEIRTGENPQLMEQLKSTLLNLQMKRTELLTKFDPSYRLVREVDQQIADAQAVIAQEIRQPPAASTTNLDPTYQLLRSELAKAEEELSGLNARAATSRNVANEYRAAAVDIERKGLEQQSLERNSRRLEDDYLLYSKKREEARVSDALDQRGILNIAVIENPVVPALPQQSIAKMAGLTSLIAFFFSIGVGLIADFASPLFRTPEEVENFLNIPVLAALPKLSS